jgi:hypothetical protein
MEYLTSSSSSINSNLLILELKANRFRQKKQRFFNDIFDATKRLPVARGDPVIRCSLPVNIFRLHFGRLRRNVTGVSLTKLNNYEKKPSIDHGHIRRRIVVRG